MEINKTGRMWVEVRSMQINTCKAILDSCFCVVSSCVSVQITCRQVIVEQLLLCGQQLPECVKLQSNSWTAAFVVW